MFHILSSGHTPALRDFLGLPDAGLGTAACDSGESAPRIARGHGHVARGAEALGSGARGQAPPMEVGILGKLEFFLFARAGN